MTPADRAPRVAMLIGVALLAAAGMFAFAWAAFWVTTSRTFCGEGSGIACLGSGWVYGVVVLLVGAVLPAAFVSWCTARRGVGPAVFGVLLGLVLQAALIAVPLVAG
jgi:hypothetical protein